MIKQEVLFTEEECNYIIDLAGDRFGRSRVGSNLTAEENRARTSYENTIKIDKKIGDFLLNKLAPLGIVSLPEYFKVIRYKVGEFFNIHTDARSDQYTSRHTSLSIQLSKNYEEGDFVIYNDLDLGTQVIASKEVGNTIIFPSSYFHEVKSISSGVRYAAVFWLSSDNMGIKKSLM